MTRTLARFGFWLQTREGHLWVHLGNLLKRNKVRIHRDGSRSVDFHA